MMSDRASFVTEYIECEKCLEEAIEYFLQSANAYDIEAEAIGGHISGIIRTLYHLEEFTVFDEYILPVLMYKICHPMRVVCIGSSNTTKLYCIEPRRKFIKEQTLITEKNTETLNACLDKIEKRIEEKFKRISVLEDKILNLEDRIEGKRNEHLDKLLEDGSNEKR